MNARGTCRENEQVPVAEKNSDDVVRMSRDPVAHLRQPISDGPGIEDVTAAMTEMRLCPVGRPLDLSLKKSDAIVQLH